jgi:hypothetical protein
VLGSEAGCRHFELSGEAGFTLLDPQAATGADSEAHLPRASSQTKKPTEVGFLCR